jgi:hypothetical protein
MVNKFPCTRESPETCSRGDHLLTLALSLTWTESQVSVRKVLWKAVANTNERYWWLLTAGRWLWFLTKTWIQNCMKAPTRFSRLYLSLILNFGGFLHFRVDWEPFLAAHEPITCHVGCLHKLHMDQECRTSGENICRRSGNFGYSSVLCLFSII